MNILKGYKNDKGCSDLVGDVFFSSGVMIMMIRVLNVFAETHLFSLTIDFWF